MEQKYPCRRSCFLIAAEQIVVHDSMIDLDEIEMGPQVGEGSYALVYKARFRSMSVAVKMVRPPLKDAMKSGQRKELLEFKREAMLMCQRSLVSRRLR